MTGIVLPDIREVRKIAADYLDLLAEQPYTAAQRARIIDACARSFVPVLVAAATADGGGHIDLRIFTVFLRDLAWQIASQQTWDAPDSP